MTLLRDIGRHVITWLDDCNPDNAEGESFGDAMLEKLGEIHGRLERMEDELPSRASQERLTNALSKHLETLIARAPTSDAIAALQSQLDAKTRGYAALRDIQVDCESTHSRAVAAESAVRSMRAQSAQLDAANEKIAALQRALFEARPPEKSPT